MQKLLQKRRTKRGTTIAEVPLGLLILFVGLAFPLICFAAMGYRIMMLQSLVRNSCLLAAKANTWSGTAAVPPSTPATQGMTTIANNVFTSGLASMHGISGSEQLYIVTKPLSGGADSFQSTHLASINTTNNLYFLRIASTCQIAPLLGGDGLFGAKIPGFNQPFPLSMTYQVYVENPNGLTN